MRQMQGIQRECVPATDGHVEQHKFPLNWLMMNLKQVWAGPKEIWFGKKKRKTTQALQLMDGLQGQQKRPTQGQQPKIMSAQPAHIELTPEGFFQVQVEKDHSSKIAKGCGLSTEVVMQILQEDNEARKIESAAPSYENLDKE